MIVKLDDRNALIKRAKYLMSKYKLNAFEAILWAEQELLEVEKNEGE